MTWYNKSARRMWRTKRKQYRRKMHPYEAETLSTRARHHTPRTRDITRYHPRDWGHFGAEIRDGDDAA